MNVMHMRYAVTVASVGSINKASELLYVAQPNLSRAIKELESELGIMIFDRSAKGMVTTFEGEEFILRAKKILEELDKMERIYKEGVGEKQRFSLCATRSSYVSQAFALFSKHIVGDEAELYYHETNSASTINGVANGEYDLGVIRFAEAHGKYFEMMLEEKELDLDRLCVFKHLVLTRKDSPLAKKDVITPDDLLGYIQITNADYHVPSMSAVATRKEDMDVNRKHVFVYERASQFDLLSENPDMYSQVSPIPQKMLDRFGLVQRPCLGHDRLYCDMLIYKKGHKFTKLEQIFISELKDAVSRFTV